MINEFFEGVSLKEIENFEKTFHIKFPEDYKIFLQTYNGGEYICPGTVLFGIGDKVPDWCSIETSYKVYDGIFPKDLVLLGWKNYGNLIVYDPKAKKYLIWSIENRCSIKEYCSLFQIIFEDIEAI